MHLASAGWARPDVGIEFAVIPGVQCWHGSALQASPGFGRRGGTAFGPLVFRDAAPVVRYEIDPADCLVRVNAAWSSFATANGALHLVAGRVIGRSLWDFVSGEATVQVYKSLLRRVRDGGRSQFAYRCDAPGRRRFMEMTMTALPDGHVRFESCTRLVEFVGARLSPPASHRDAPPGICLWCTGRQPPDRRPDTLEPSTICEACLESVLCSVHYDAASVEGLALRATF